MYNFLLVINTNLLPILHRFRDIRPNPIFPTSLAFNPPQWRGSLHHIIVNDISLKLEALDYIPVAESLGISSTTFTQCAPNATYFAEITKITAIITPFQVIQGHRFWYQSKAHMRLPISA